MELSYFSNSVVVIAPHAFGWRVQSSLFAFGSWQGQHPYRCRLSRRCSLHLLRFRILRLDFAIAVGV